MASPLQFKELKSVKSLEEILEFDVKAFMDLPGIEWTKKGLEKAKKDGWHIFSALISDSIVAAVMFQNTGNELHTKNTSIKLEHQGNAYSHAIKEFYEEKAAEFGASKIINLCRKDDFRTISLNETHGYEKEGSEETDEGIILLWSKTLDKKS